MRDLYDIMNDDVFGNDNSYTSAINLDDGSGMGSVLGFADYLSSRDSIYDLMDEDDIFDDIDAIDEDGEEPYRGLTPLKARNNKKDVPVPAFEQYVQKVCGLK